jgi:hypothetical protein
VWLNLTFLAQFGTLGYSEPVLLVDNHDTQRFELNNVFDESVCPNQDMYFSS